MKLNSIAFALALASSMAAQAADGSFYDLSKHDAEYQVNFTSKGEFTDTYAFTYLGFEKILASLTVSELKVSTSKDIVWSSFKVLDDAGNVIVVKTASDSTATDQSLPGGGTVNFLPGSVGLFALDAVPISAKFSLVLTGSAVGTGPISGSYNLQVAALPAPVPEPESYALLMAGLGLVGFLARRRGI